MRSWRFESLESGVGISGVLIDALEEQR